MSKLFLWGFAALLAVGSVALARRTITLYRQLRYSRNRRVLDHARQEVRALCAGNENARMNAADPVLELADSMASKAAILSGRVIAERFLSWCDEFAAGDRSAIMLASTVANRGLPNVEALVGLLGTVATLIAANNRLLGRVIRIWNHGDVDETAPFEIAMKPLLELSSKQHRTGDETCVLGFARAVWLRGVVLRHAEKAHPGSSILSRPIPDREVCAYIRQTYSILTIIWRELGIIAHSLSRHHVEREVIRVQATKQADEKKVAA